MNGGDQIRPSPSKAGQVTLGCGGNAVAGRAEHCDRDITDQHGARSEAFGYQIAHRDRGGCKQQVRGVIGQDPVEFLGHPRVEAAQACLHVGDAEAALAAASPPASVEVVSP